MEHKRRAWVVPALILLATAVGATTGCDRADPPPRWKIQVLATRPHDRAAFTEGLEIDGNTLYESSGLEGRSFVRATDANSGAQLARADLAPEFFGEGLTLAGSTLWQLTWKNGVAFARDPHTLAEQRRVHYDGEGWGLCARRGRLVMSNGTGTLTFRDPTSFAVTGTVRLTSHDDARLNELDCAPDGSVYADVWPTDEILRIDPDTGKVLADIDAGRLLTPLQQIGADVLNGIADLPGTDHFLITGKNWPLMYEVRFVPA